MNSLTPLVPEKTYAVCTQGTKKGEMVVGYHNNVYKANTCLIATVQDKPTNFACVWTGILIAVVGGAIAALYATGVGSLIAGVLIATLAGILAAHGLGGVVCYFFLRPASWVNPHPKIIINGEQALIGSSTIVCKPLGFGTGNVTLYYSKEVADRIANIYKWQNYAKIFGGALTGASAIGLWGLGTSIATIYGLGAGIGTVAGFLGFGYLVGKPINDFQNWASDKITGRDTEGHTRNLRDTIDGSNAPAFDLSVRQSLMTQYGNAQGGVVMTDGWTAIKADPRYYPGMPASELQALKSEYFSRGHENYNTTKNNAATRETLAQGIRNAALFLGFTVGVNIFIQVIYKNELNELEEFGLDSEIDARSAVKIFEGLI